MSTIPVIQPANPAAPLPVTGTTAGVVANVNAISQDLTNFLPIFGNASTNVKAAQANAQAAGLDPFHTALSIFLAADQSITPYVPYAPVQAFGGIAALAATFLGLIPNKQTSTAATVATVVTNATVPVPASTTTAPVSPTPASAPTVASLEAEVTSQEQQIAALQAQLAQKIAAPAASTATTTATEYPRTASAQANPATAKLSGGGLGGFFKGIGHEVAHPTETLQSAEAAAAKKS